MFDNSEWTRLTGVLLELTRQQRLTWRLDPLSDEYLGTQYVTSPSESTLYRLYSKDGDNRFPFVFEIHNIEEGRRRKIAEFETTPYDDSFGAHSASSNVDELFTLISRLISGVPQVFNQLLDELESLRPHDEKPF